MTSPEEQTRRAIHTAGERIKALGLTIGGFAETKHLPVSTVTGWLRKRTMSLTTLVTLANAVGLRPAVLLLSAEEQAYLAQTVEALRSRSPALALWLDNFLKGV